MNLVVRSVLNFKPFKPPYHMKNWYKKVIFGLFVLVMIGTWVKNGPSFALTWDDTDTLTPMYKKIQKAVPKIVQNTH